MSFGMSCLLCVLFYWWGSYNARCPGKSWELATRCWSHVKGWVSQK
jgi:hypothetical protein